MKLNIFLLSSFSLAQRINLRNFTDRITEWDDQFDFYNKDLTQHWDREQEDAEGNQTEAEESFEDGYSQRIFNLREDKDLTQHWDREEDLTQHWDRELEKTDGGKKMSEESFDDDHSQTQHWDRELENEEETKRWSSDVEDGTCWKCRERSAADCLQWGRKVDCYDHEVCQITERRRGGKAYFIEAKCKQKFGACQINQQQNMKTHQDGPEERTECHNQRADFNGAEIPSTCRQCASSASSVKEFLHEIDLLEDFNGLPVESWMANLDEK